MNLSSEIKVSTKYSFVFISFHLISLPSLHFARVVETNSYQFRVSISQDLSYIPGGSNGAKTPSGVVEVMASCAPVLCLHTCPLKHL